MLEACARSAFIAGMLLMLACNDGAASSPSDAAVPHAQGGVEIFSWWTSGGERDALEALLQVHDDRVGGARVRNAAVEFADKAREELQERMRRGLPPDTFQANIGADLVDWVRWNRRDTEDAKVESLQRLAGAAGWLDDLDSTLVDAASVDGELFAVPLNIHRINTLFYRSDLFERFELTPPQSLQQLLSLCGEVASRQDIQSSRPAGVSCLALGNKWDWTLSLVAFEMILPALAGGAYYESFWRGDQTPDDGMLEAVLEATFELYCGGSDGQRCEQGFFNANIDDIDWAQGVMTMAEGEALMAPMGDWAKGLLDAQGLVAGEDYDAIPFPGTSGIFVFTADTFPLPKGAAHRAGVVELFATLVSPEGQIAFNRLKGSIPVNADADREAFDDLAQRTMDDYESADERVMALSGLMSSDVMPDLASMLKRSLQSGSSQALMNYVRASYGSI